jgi:hypothetical protein
LLALTLLAGTDMAEAIACNAPGAEAAAAAVRRLNEEYIDAARTGNAAWFRRHMAEDVVVILGTGKRLGKTEFLSQFDAPKAFRSLTLRNVTLRVFGPTVQVDADAPWELADGHRGVSRYIDTYAWLDGRWQVVSAQITLLPASGEP